MNDFYRRKLPHWHPQGQTFFITFRLANSLPFSVIQELKQKFEQERQTLLSKFKGGQQQDELHKLDKKHFGQFDSWLDKCAEDSPRWLADEHVANIISDEIHILDGERYKLIAFCIMSNHVHLLIDTNEHTFKPEHIGVTAEYPVADTLKQLKGRRLASVIRHWSEADNSGTTKVMTMSFGIKRNTKILPHTSSTIRSKRVWWKIGTSGNLHTSVCKSRNKFRPAVKCARQRKTFASTVI